ncbi:MAG TPA: hypothetical protein VG934_03180 [Candidatus Paceibacterota bacterium]|nr:hypothetical protein [Candidatus Paceibacterota bacterium]
MLVPAHSRAWLEWQLARRPFVPKQSPLSSLGSAVAVIAVPFNCYLHEQPPDASNQKIAEIAAKYMEICSLPFFGQWEHTSLLREFQLKGKLSAVRIEEFQSSNGERVMSQRLVKWQAQQVLGCGKGGNKVILVGMPEHLGRVKILCEYFGLDPRIPADCMDVPYDPSARSGAQDWCKSWEAFSRYEVTTGRLGTIAYALLGLV